MNDITLCLLLKLAWFKHHPHLTTHYQLEQYIQELWEHVDAL